MIVVDLCQIAPLSPTCVVGRAAGVAGDALLATLGDGFARAAAAVLDAVFAAIATATTVDVAAPYVTRNAAALTAVAAVVVVGLFVVQVTTAAVRREPAGLTRAVTGAAVAVLGAAAAGTITAALLAAVDALCEGIAALAGTSIDAAARKLLDVTVLTQLGNVPGGPALMLLFGLLFILGATLTLGTLLVRQALIVIAVVVAPLAFAGATARLTSGWVHRWVQLTLALILSKLAIVIVFVVAVGLLGETSWVGWVAVRADPAAGGLPVPVGLLQGAGLRRHPPGHRRPPRHLRRRRVRGHPRPVHRHLPDPHRRHHRRRPHRRCRRRGSGSRRVRRVGWVGSRSATGGAGSPTLHRPTPAIRPRRRVGRRPRRRRPRKPVAGTQRLPPHRRPARGRWRRPGARVRLLNRPLPDPQPRRQHHSPSGGTR